MISSPVGRFTHYLHAILVIAILFAAQASPAQTAPGGILETITTAQTRAILSPSQIQSFLPSRGTFTFPAPYNTEAARITNSSDCAGSDCVNYIGYSFWRNINNHVGNDTMYFFVGLNRSRGGAGPTLFSYNKVSDVLTKVGPLFDSNSNYSWYSAEGWYFSATMPSKLYIMDGANMRRYDIFTKQFETVFDVRPNFGSDKYIWNMHSSNDDRVHAATLRTNTNWAMLGCVVYREDTKQFSYYPRVGDFDECQIDKSGRWLVIKENIDGADGEDNRIIDLSTGTERTLLDRNGAAGHSDMGYGYMIAADNYANMANTQKLWQLNSNTLLGITSYYNFNWGVSAPAHVSHTNARADLLPGQQYVCGSSANRNNSPHANEIVCFRNDSSGQVLVVAPVMTDLNASGGGDDYAKSPKGNLDVTGKYFIWTSNTGGNRLDAFLVKVPSHLLTGTTTPADTTAPTISITAPVNGESVSSTVTVAANANDNIGVTGVQFRLGGVNLGSEDTSAPYATSWNTTTATGSHVLTAVARDAAGNTKTSSAVSVTIAGDTSAPVISSVSAQIVLGTSATIVWTTNEPGDTQVEFGLTTAYGTSTSINLNLLTAHSQVLSGLNSGTLYHYRVKSMDSAGNLAVSGDFTFTTTAGTILDVTPPTVAITSPANNQSNLSGTIAVTANASDNTGVAGVQFRLDGVNLGTEDTSAPYSVAWNTANATAGGHNLTAIARDAAGNTGTSSTISVSIAASTSSPGNAILQPVTWTNLVNVTATGNSLQKTSGCDGCPDAGAVSQQQISGDGYLEFTVNETQAMRYVGLTNTHTGTSATEIAFALRFQAGSVEVRENGVYRRDTGFNAGDVFRIEVKTNTVTYARNGSVFYTSTVVPGYPLRADTSFNSINATVNNVVISSLPLIVGHWKLDESNGVVAADTSGKGNTGTLVNGPVWTTGLVGGSLKLDGVDDYVDVPHKATLNSYPLTIALWMKTGATGLHALVNKYAPGSMNGYQLFVNNGNLCAWYFRNKTNYVWDGSGCTLSTPGYADNQWHHVVFVVDAQGGSLYVDGIQKASRVWTGTPAAASTKQRLSLGRYPGTAAPYLPGTLDDVRLYNQALDTAAISTLYNAVPRPQPVTWTDLVNVTASGSSLQKTSGCDGCPDAGAVSQQQISGDGYLEFTVNETQAMRYVGLTHTHSGTSASEIAFALRFQAGAAEVRETGVYRRDTGFNAGDVFRIEVKANIVTYARNGTVFHTSTAVPAYPLRADTSFYSLNATVSNVTVFDD